MGNSTSSSSPTASASSVGPGTGPGTASGPKKSSAAGSRFNKRLVNGVVLNRTSTPSLSKITKLEAQGELFKYGSKDHHADSHADAHADDTYIKERQRSVVSSQGSDRTAQDASIVSTTSNSSLSSISSSSMVDIDDQNTFQHIEEIDKDIHYEHIEGVGLSAGDSSVTTPQHPDADKIDVVIRWPIVGNERDVHIIGDFTNWKKKLKLHRFEHEYSIRLTLPKGLYKIQFLINNREMKISNHLPMATDTEGNIVNWFEVFQLHHDNASEPYVPLQPTTAADSGAALEAGSMETRRLGKKAMSLDNLLRNVALSPASGSGPTTPSGESDHQHQQPSVASQSSSQQRSFPYNTNQRHISNQSTISAYSVNESSSINSVSTYHYKASPKPTLHYSSELPDFYFKDEYAYPYPAPTDAESSASYYKKINFDEYLSDKLDLQTPPELPAYLDSLLINDDHHHHHSKNNKLNDLNVDKYTGLNYSGLDNIPNHVILKHLITTNIKNNVMMVTVINRYEGKYVYQALYSPVDI